MKISRPVRKINGFTLIELMVAMLLSLILMGAVVQMFLGNKTTHQLTEELARVQENARYAAYVLESSIRMAGFLGCSGRSSDTAVVNYLQTNPNTFSPENGIEGWETSTEDTTEGNYAVIADAPVSDASVAGFHSSSAATGGVLNADTQAVANADILRVWHVDGDGAPGTLAGTTFSHTSTPGYAANDMAMLSNCKRVDIAHVCPSSTTTATEFNCANNHIPFGLLNDGQPNVRSYKLSGWLFYIGKRGDIATNPPTLYRKPISQNAAVETAEELVEGIESMQLTYGEDMDADADGMADRYVSAHNVSDWKKVVSVRIQLLMQSERDDVVKGTQDITFNGLSITTSDGRLRYPFTTTVSLRNRIQ